MPDYAATGAVSNRKPRVLIAESWETAQVPDELIELIDADPSVFGGSSGRGAGDGAGWGRGSGRGRDDESEPDSPRRTLPWRPILLCTGAALLVGGVVATLAVWQPWVDDPRLVLTDVRAAESELSQQLVLDPAPDDVAGTTLDGVAEGMPWRDDSVGYFFTSQDATIEPDDGGDQWFGFFAEPSGGQSAPLIFGQRQIAGAPAELSNESDGELIQLAWGPVDGYTFTAAASNLTEDAAVAIAEQLRVVDDRPVVLDRAALGELMPLGSFGDYTSLIMLSAFSQNTERSLNGLVGVYYGDNDRSVVSTVGNASALDMVPFALHDEVTEGTVHGERALGFSVIAGAFGGFQVATVVWWEGGRLVFVVARGTIDEAFAVAETVRPATDAEWATVLAHPDP